MLGHVVLKCNQKHGLSASEEIPTSPNKPMNGESITSSSLRSGEKMQLTGDHGEIERQRANGYGDKHQGK